VAYSGSSNGAEQLSQSNRVLLVVPAVVPVRVGIHHDDRNSTRYFKGHTWNLKRLFASHGSIKGAPQSEIVGQAPIKQMDEVTTPVHVRMRLQRQALKPARGGRVFENGFDPIRLRLRMFGGIVLQD